MKELMGSHKEMFSDENIQILRDIATKEKSQIFYIKDFRLKESITHNDNIITSIIPDQTSGKFSVIFNRPTGNWMAKIKLKDNNIIYTLYKNEGSNVNPSWISSTKMSDDFMKKSIQSALPKELLESIISDLKNVPKQTSEKLNKKDLEYIESIDKKYGISKTYGDLIQGSNKLHSLKSVKKQPNKMATEANNIREAIEEKSKNDPCNK
ncbi:MAG: hypothetical protein HRT73_16735 [Flavobacteriales bacterium]|nr:hypothetical protein [Flavobacteriales bacterium]